VKETVIIAINELVPKLSESV